MKREIKFRTGVFEEIDDLKYKIMEKEEWLKEGKKRFGEDFMKWRFRCPMCGHIASVKEFIEAGADDPNCAYQECIGRYKDAPVTGDTRQCFWTAYGIDGLLNGKGIIVIEDDGKGTKCFDFAD